MESAHLKADSVGASEIGTGAVGSDEVADGSIDTADLNDAAVTAAKMAATLDLFGRTITLPVAIWLILCLFTPKRLARSV